MQLPCAKGTSAKLTCTKGKMESYHAQREKIQIIMRKGNKRKIICAKRASTMGIDAKLKVHKRENFLGSDFEYSTFS